MALNSTSTAFCNAAGHLGPSLAEICNSSKFVVFMSLLNELMLSNDKISGACQRVRSIETPDDEYDFVVIGGGAGGCVVAGRLSENPDFKILVLEAGHDEPAGGQVPPFMLNLIGTTVDWNYTTTNESHACLGQNGSCSFSSGKMLGGNTAHNGMIYMRGNQADYDHWAALGNVGWTWDEVKPFFLKSEDNGEINRVGGSYHSTGGPLSVERFPHLPPFGKSCLKAAVQAGYGISDDLNGAQNTGFSISQTTSKHGVRRSTSRAFLWPARNRKNLHVALNSLATRVIIENNKAVGVEYYQKDKLKRVFVTREVVISAGTIKSPQILMLSGIGPKKHLELLGIKVVKDLPGVGRNFHDHCTFMLSYTINEPDRYDDDWDIAAEYLASQNGPLSCTGLGQIQGKLGTKEAKPDDPDLQLYFNGFMSACAPREKCAVQSTGKRTVAIRVVNNHPKSRGRITLASKDPLEYPVIWGNYLSNTEDVDRLVQAIELAQKMAGTEALEAHNFTLSNEPLKACSSSDHSFLSKEYWTCAVHQQASPEGHMVGTCKMGPCSDPLAVVDHRLRVHGIEGLRVADASVMPQVTSGNTATPTMMIGERAADFMEKDWTQ